MKINAIITGTTGMIGRGLLLECLDSPDVESVLSVTRRPVGIDHPKLDELIINDFFDLSPVAGHFEGFNTCFFCLGVSAFRMSETDYSRITHDLTLHFAATLLERNPGMTFCYVSGAGTDSSESGRMMWARVKGRTENDLLALPFKKAYMFRPGYIQPKKGIKSSTPMYNAMYSVVGISYPLLKTIFPKKVTTTDELGRAMIRTVMIQPEKAVLETDDIYNVGRDLL